MVQKASEAIGRVLARCRVRVDRLYLVGGLGSSYFTQQLKQQFANRVTQVEVTDYGYSAVLQGRWAVLQGR